MSSDLIFKLDRQQAVENKDRRVCKNDKRHGGLWAHKSGMVLVCGLCDYNEPANISLSDDE